MAICTEVIDGDTLDVNIADGSRSYTKIRLIGVDTPEIAHGGQPVMHFGPEAREFTRSAVLGKQVRLVLQPEQARDRYERLLAYIYYGQPEEMLNERLVVQGMGYADTRFKHAWKEKFVQDEQRARHQKLGLWSAVKPEEMPAWRRRADERGSSSRGHESEQAPG